MNWRIIGLCSALLLVACGGGSGSGNSEGSSGDKDPSNKPCVGQCADDARRLTITDVEQILAQAIAQSRAMGEEATIAVVDRVGNVLAVHRMAASAAEVAISTTFPTTVTTGLEGVVLPAGLDGDALAAIAKAVTAAYLSSEGNAFSTRTANQIVQEHFNPGEKNQPGGPLFGVQFSQFACSDFTLSPYGVTREGTTTANLGPLPAKAMPGPQRSPLGLAADPGGFPLYKNGTAVGGVGVIADGRYSIDQDVFDIDRDVDELIAFAASFGFAAPLDRRAERITVEGKSFRFSDVDFADLAEDPAQAPAYDSLVNAGSLVAVKGYSRANIIAGTAFGSPESGIRPADGYAELDAFIFVDANNQNRYPLRAGSDAALLAVDALSANEVQQLLQSAITVANRSRAQIRRPLGSQARVTVSVVDSQGVILGMLRTRDAPVFGADVSLQKARTATLFSSRDAADFLRSISTPTVYVDSQLSPKAQVLIPDYVEAAQSFIGPQALTDGIAFSDRAGGNLSRPFYPDGIRGNRHGPFSKSFDNNEWSVFSTGLQLDLSLNKVLQHLLFTLGAIDEDVGPNCVESTVPRLANGSQIFPGSVPIYRGDTLVGGIGVSGDGIEQDDMISFLGLHEAGLALGGSINNAPPEMRADRLEPAGQRLRYIQCPQTPYLDSDEQFVCAGK
ncbi:heme-binding protein [Parahaliea sp. F7430]|uniref:Heme-binding protein n=1 Tax=Sediminihaliea albiluteola TaxID=2758564 RepID=A0A7W2YIJ0_9GAMM|nr:heme-binding protein [Sediminihaliea albiluteola]MBA6411574.1 heme-binding protein [Sediminihaliea albiluteola]